VIRRRALTCGLVAAAGIAVGAVAMGQDLSSIEVLRTKAVPGGQAYSLTLQALGLMTLLTLLPAIILSMTAFTRIVIVLGVLRQAIGAAQTPPNQVLVGLALFLTLFVMAPTLNEVQSTALAPYVEEKIPFEEAVVRAVVPMKKFMLAQTRESDLKMFMDLAKTPAVRAPMDTPLTVLLPAFLTSELRTAFTIGFLIYIPFLVIRFPRCQFCGSVAMNDTAVVEIVREAMWVGGLSAGPILLLVLVIGVLVGIFQAATSINEMTLSFVPKLIAVMLLVLLIGSWPLQVLVDFTRRIFERIPDLGQ